MTEFGLTSIGVKKNDDMNLNSLSGSSTIAGNNLGIHIGGLAQKIINHVKDKLEMQGKYVAHALTYATYNPLI